MIALAVADWPLSRRLLAQGTITVDWLETPGFLAESTAALFPSQPLLLHTSLSDVSLSHPEALVLGGMLAETVRLLGVTHAPWFSAHLGFSAAEVVFDVFNRPRSELLTQDAMFATICSNARALARAIPVPLLLENLDYCPGGAYEHVCEPAFISAVIETSDAGLLLDLAHARVSAAALDLPIERYLAALPLHRVRQLHVSGPRLRDGVLADAHEPLLDVDYELLAAVLGMLRPDAVTLEYSKREDALCEQLARLRELLTRADTRGYPGGGATKAVEQPALGIVPA